MANNVSALIKQRYTKEVQSLLESQLVSYALANTSLVSQMPDGNTINYPRPNYSSTAQYVKYTDVTSQDVVFSNETLVIDKHPYISFVIDIEDEQDIGWDLISGETERAAYLLKEEIDGDFFNQYQYADNVSTAPVTLVAGASQNVTSTYGNAFAALANNGVNTSRVGVVVDPFQMNFIGQAGIANTFTVADANFRNGYTGGMFQGMKVFVSNNLTCTGSLVTSAQFTEGQTVTINGVVFTFKASPVSAGDVDIGLDAATSTANLVAAINGGAGAGTAYIDFTDKTRANKLRGLTATNNTTSILLTSKRGYKVTSAAAGATNKWGALTIHNIVMEQGAIHLVMRNEVMLKVEDVQKQLGKRFITHTRYGLKTFSDGQERMYDLQIVAQAAA